MLAVSLADVDPPVAVAHLPTVTSRAVVVVDDGGGASFPVAVGRAATVAAALLAPGTPASSSGSPATHTAVTKMHHLTPPLIRSDTYTVDSTGRSIIYT